VKYRQERVFAGKGPEPHQFTKTLRGLTVDKDEVYVVGDSEVKVYDSSGVMGGHWPTSRPGYSVAVDGDRVFVGQEGQLEIFDKTHRLLSTWSDSEKLGLVTAIDHLPDHVLVADSRDRCIRRFDRMGNFVNNIGKDNRRHGFLIPNGAVDFAVDAAGIIHAANPGKHRVERYTPEGELLGHIGRFDGRDPEGFPGCCNPTNVTVAEKGFVYVTEKAGPRAKVYDAEGRLLAVIATDVFDLACKNMDIAVDSKGRVYVAETEHLEVHQFVPEAGEGQP
jgi:hypothetical protein